MKLSYVQLGDDKEKRPVCFSLSAIEEIEEKFGGLDKMRDGLTKGKVKTITTVLEIMLRAGENYCKGMGIDCPPPLKCRPSDLIDVRDKSVVEQIFAAISADSERDIELSGKN